MVEGVATHSLESHSHETHSHELVRAPVGARTRVGAGKYVTINYTLRTNGAIRHIRSAVWGDEPLEYLHGGGRLLPALERALEGKAEGERFVVTLPPEDAYGVSATRHCSSGLPPRSLAASSRSKPGCAFSRTARTASAWRM